MGDYNKIEGCIEVPVAGGTLKLRGRVRNLVKAKYEDWLEGRARKRVFRMHEQGELDAAQYKASLAAVTEEVGAFTFAWGGDAWQRSMRQVPGLAQFVLLLAEDAGERIDHDRLLSLMRDDASRESITSAVREVIAASANFTSPPGETVD